MKLKPKRCSYCKNMFEPKNRVHKVCSHDCAIGLHEKSVSKAVKASNREALKRLKTRSQWLKEAQVVFNKYIRLRDADLPCISCKRFHSGQYHAGHYRTVGSAPHLRFDESNCHKQCAPCNNHLSGNIINYRRGLIERIGIAMVESIESNQSTFKPTIEQIQDIIKIYKQKIKEIEAR